MEHRWGQRIPAALPVRLTCRPGAIGSGYLRDVSVSGAFVQTDLILPILSPIEIDADLNPWGLGETQPISAWIVRRDAMGVGVEWSEFAPEAICALLVEALGEHALPGSRARALVPERLNL